MSLSDPRCVAIALSMFVAGCAAMRDSTADAHRLPPTDRHVVVEHGAPHKVLDGMAAVVQFPRPWLTRLSKHPERYNRQQAVQSAAAFLEDNDLADVTVLVHRHDPAGEWQRLRKNTSVTPWARYSLGALSWVAYNLFPPRIWGFDYYNSFTNSLHLDSDSVPLAMYHAASARQVHGRKFPAARTVAASLPPFSFDFQRRCTNDLIAYARAQDDWDMERDVYEVIYPIATADALTLGVLLYPAWWAYPAARLGGATIGSVAGQAAIRRRKAERKQTPRPPTHGQVELATHHEPPASSSAVRIEVTPSPETGAAPPKILAR